MRITNKMMTSNMQTNITRNKKNMSVLGNQYSTKQKIQRPSEDPVVAVRSLKYRTQLTELNQYYQKNIPDALGWMDITESAMDSANGILTYINTYCNQGASDSLSSKNRNSIIETLKEYTEQIYQYGNTDYAGRYVFTGYRTDTPLLFDKETTDLKYTITEQFTGMDINTISYVYNETGYDATKTTAADYAADAPTIKEAHRIRLAYGELDHVAGDSATSTPGSFKELSFLVQDASGVETKTVINEFGLSKTVTPPGTTTTDTSFQINYVSSKDLDAYNLSLPATSNTISFVYDTGEIIIPDGLYSDMQKSNAISVQYDKTKFEKGDVKPIHYFACETVDAATGLNPISYAAPNQQNIQYEINFSQKLTVNTMACNSFGIDIGRTIKEIEDAAAKLQDSESKLAEVEKMIADTTDATKRKTLEELKNQLITEVALKGKVLQDKFGKGITMSTNEQDRINVSLADHGSRYTRLELTESRLSAQQVDFKDMLEKNDSVNLEDVIIDYSAAEVTYNASLSSAAKVVTNTLLDFL